LGDAQRLSGHLEAARDYYEESWQRYHALGSTESVIPRLNQSLTLLADERYDEARGLLSECRRLLERIQRRAFLGVTDVFLLPCHASARDWGAWDEAIELGVQRLEESGFADPDVAWAAELGAQVALKEDEPSKARAAYELARDQWRRLKRHTELAAVDGLLAGLEP